MTRERPQKLISLDELARELGVYPYNLRRVCALGLIPHAQSQTTNARFILASDHETIRTLRVAVKLSKDYRITLDKAIRMVKNGVNLPDELKEYA